MRRRFRAEPFDSAIHLPEFTAFSPRMLNVNSKTGALTLRVHRACESESKPCDCLRFESQGAVFDFPWHLELMSQLHMAIECSRGECGGEKWNFEGIVIDCRQTGLGSFETTVIFLSPADACGAEHVRFVHLPN